MKREEKDFLHDLAGPLGTAMLLIDTALDSLKDQPDVPQEEVSQIRDAYQELLKVKKLFQERREALLEGGQDA